MSNFRAIGGVSRTLRRLLLDRIDQPNQVAVTIAPPDAAVENVTGTRLNLYLYQIVENTYLKNQEIPGQGYPGAYGHPPLSLELRYLLTASAEDETIATADATAQEVLGDAMRVLHDFSIVMESLTITRASAGIIDDAILDPDLEGEFEHIKITLLPLTLDDFSKIWSALPDANFRRSVAYEVSVVQIESQRARLYPRLVGQPDLHIVAPPPVRPTTGPRIYVEPFQIPQIREVLLRRAEDTPNTERRFPYARIGDTLILKGRNFASDTTRVFLSGVNATPQIGMLRGDRLEVQIPDDGDLQPGPQTVQVAVEVMMGEPPMPHIGYQSNRAVFMLIPDVDTLALDNTTPPGTLQITGTRLYHEDWESLTLVGDTLIPSAAYTTRSSTTITFNLPGGLSSGNSYVVRVRVNGVESLEEILTIA